ncbi:response regulator [candidate division KSB1 bacterium]
MPVVTIVSGTYCSGDEISRRVAEELGYELLTNEMLFEEATEKFDTTSEKLNRALYNPPSFFNNLTHEREKNIAYLKEIFADKVEKDNLVYHGFAAHLLPREISHVLNIYVNADKDYRIEKLTKSENISEKEAVKIIRKDDNDAVRWTYFLFNKSPWDKTLYDEVIPLHTYSVDSAVKMICENAKKDTIKPTDKSKSAVKDLIFTSKVGRALAEKDHFPEVICKDGKITIFAMKQVLRPDHYKQELEDIAQTVSGLVSVEVQLSSGTRLIRDFEDLQKDIPTKVLLVDDEIEFVHTLSERLKARNIESSFVYDGEEALNFVKEEEPEVMILDLKMPGIDGLEVLRQVKQTNPDVEVIILTGHGSEREKTAAKEMGVFAYLNKPLDIEELAEAMKAANDKIKAKIADKNKPE